MNQAPWTDIGNLQSEIRDIKNQLNQKSEKYEIHEINRRLDALEHSIREIRSENYGILSRLQALEEKRLRQGEEVE